MHETETKASDKLFYLAQYLFGVCVVRVHKHDWTPHTPLYWVLNPPEQAGKLFARAVQRAPEQDYVFDWLWESFWKKADQPKTWLVSTSTAGRTFGVSRVMYVCAAKRVNRERDRPGLGRSRLFRFAFKWPRVLLN